jgi:hypothetical protein
MCFKCGAEAHPGSSCNKVGNAELRKYILENDVVKCPNCGFGTEKIDGCNHMTCAKCNYGWCWICRGKYRNGHFSELNIFGCPGGQFSENTWCQELALKLLILIGIPFILILGPVAGVMTGCLECWHWETRFRTCIFWPIFLIIQLPLVLGIGFTLGAISFALGVVPAYLL